MSAMPGLDHVLFVCDRVNARNGRSVWTQRFVDSCGQRGLKVHLAGDEPEFFAPAAHLRYHSCQAGMPPELFEPEEGWGLAPRPFLALSSFEADDDVAGCMAALQRIAAARGEPLARLQRLDTLAKARELPEIESELERALTSSGATTLCLLTQSYLGLGALTLARRNPGLRVVTFRHSDYGSIFYHRLVAPLPRAERAGCEPLREAQWRRAGRHLLGEGAQVLCRSLHDVVRLRAFGAPPGTHFQLLLPTAPPGLNAAAVPVRSPHDGPLRVLVACRMEDDRGLELLQEVVRQSPQHQFTFCGEGPRRAALEAAIPQARFLGHVSQPRLSDLRRESDVFLHASTTDTYSEAVVEAMAAGLAVIATNVGGPVGYLVDGENGLTRPADPETWLQALEQLASSAALRASLGANAVRTVASMPWSGHVDAVIAALASAVR